MSVFAKLSPVRNEQRRSLKILHVNKISTPCEKLRVIFDALLSRYVDV